MFRDEERNFRILLVDDNPDDVTLTKEIFTKCHFQNEIDVVEDGVEAVKYLKKEGSYSDALRPDLILLDLKLPKLSGKDVLQIIKNEDMLKKIPVIILSTSNDYKDVEDCYNLYANCYIPKPFNISQYTEVIRQIQSFWFGIACLPEDNSF